MVCPLAKVKGIVNDQCLSCKEKVNTRVEFVCDFRRLGIWLLCNDIFLRTCRHGVVMLMSVFVQNIVDIILYFALWVIVLKKVFSNIIEGRL